MTTLWIIPALWEKQNSAFHYSSTVKVFICTRIAKMTEKTIRWKRSDVKSHSDIYHVIIIIKYDYIQNHQKTNTSRSFICNFDNKNSGKSGGKNVSTCWLLFCPTAPSLLLSNINGLKYSLGHQAIYLYPFYLKAFFDISFSTCFGCLVPITTTVKILTLSKFLDFHIKPFILWFFLLNDFMQKVGKAWDNIRTCQQFSGASRVQWVKITLIKNRKLTRLNITDTNP